MEVELVGRADLDSALPDWAALHAADPAATPFQAPGWGEAWLRHWEPEAEPWLLRVRDGTGVVALAPLAVRRRGPVRLLETIGREPGDYWDVLARPDAREEAVAALAAEVLRRRREWDVAHVACLPPESPTPAALAGAGLRVLGLWPSPCPGIELPGSFDEYLAMLPSQRRGNLRRHLKRLDGGELELRAVTDPAQLPDTIARWQELRERQWGETGRRIDEEHLSRRFGAFMLDVTRALVPAGLALVWEVRREGAVAGVYVNLVDERAFYWYLGGFDPALASLGVGKIVIGASIRESVAAGRRYYDFTRGSEPYKYWYGATDRQAAALVLGHGGARSRAALVAARTVAALRRRRRAAQP